jgi:anti-anti-sigma factor
VTEKSTITFPERFDFYFHKSFTAAYEPLLNNASLKQLELDFKQVQYLDSAALGMLVLMRKKFSQNINISIVGARGTAREIIEMANLSKLFTII